jgi:hypothetical protein
MNEEEQGEKLILNGSTKVYSDVAVLLGSFTV